MTRAFDLFGNPLPANAGSPGRNEHAPDPEIARKIRMLLVAHWSMKDIADEVGLSVPTIRKHYFASGKVNAKQARQRAAAEGMGRALLKLDEAAEAGSVSAASKLYGIIEKEALRDLPPAFDTPTKKPKAKGKKERRHDEAQVPSGGWDAIISEGPAH